MKPLPNYAEDATVDIKFNVFDSNGEPGNLTGTLTGSVEVWKTGNNQAHTQAYTPALLDAMTGVYTLTIDMSANAFFEIGKDYTAVLTGAGITASGTAVTNTILARWSCQNQVSTLPDGTLTADTFASGVLSTDAEIATAVDTELAADFAAIPAATATEVHAGTILTGTVTIAATTTVIPFSSTVPALTVANQVKGRVLLFATDTTTAALRGQGAPIDSSTTEAITLAAGDALTTTPANGDTFVIV